MMTKWHLKLFKRLLKLYSSQFNCCLSTNHRKKNTSALIQNTVSGMFMKHARAAGEQSVPRQHASNNTIPRLTKRHFLRKVAPKTEKSNSQRRCVVYSEHRKKKSSVYYCQMCDVGLRLEECCELYRMKLNY
jgi:hypothetical protein